MGLCWQMPKFIVWRLWSIYFDHHLPPSIGKRRKRSCTPNMMYAPIVQRRIKIKMERKHAYIRVAYFFLLLLRTCDQNQIFQMFTYNMISELVRYDANWGTKFKISMTKNRQEFKNFTALWNDWVRHEHIKKRWVRFIAVYK